VESRERARGKKAAASSRSQKLAPALWEEIYATLIGSPNFRRACGFLRLLTQLQVGQLRGLTRIQVRTFWQNIWRFMITILPN